MDFSRLTREELEEFLERFQQLLPLNSQDLIQAAEDLYSVLSVQSGIVYPLPVQDLELAERVLSQGVVAPQKYSPEQIQTLPEPTFLKFAQTLGLPVEDTPLNRDRLIRILRILDWLDLSFSERFRNLIELDQLDQLDDFIFEHLDDVSIDQIYDELIESGKLSLEDFEFAATFAVRTGNWYLINWLRSIDPQLDGQTLLEEAVLGEQFLTAEQILTDVVFNEDILIEDLFGRTLEEKHLPGVKFTLNLLTEEAESYLWWDDEFLFKAVETNRPDIVEAVLQALKETNQRSREPIQPNLKQALTQSRSVQVTQILNQFKE